MGYFGVHQGTGIGLLMLRSRLQEKMGTKKRSQIFKMRSQHQETLSFSLPFPGQIICEKPIKAY
jgi:hypothetical protein